jgi:aspartate aminotransferase
MEIARSWLLNAHVAVTPGSAFYSPTWIRISYAAALPKLEEALHRIKAQKEFLPT